MSLSTDQVKNIAKLARLSLSEAEIDKFSNDLNQILAYVEQLQELDTQGIEPMLGAVQNQKPHREDKALDSGLRDAMLRNAPDSEDTSIKVPQMS
jgi:aspartyl-tRNA(Asn)/glutamyl-tRNA(Gln) amidotransferase subunit C